MANKLFQNTPVTNQQNLTGPASTAISVGDLLYLDTATGLPKPLTSLTTGASEAVDQATVAQVFLGLAVSQMLAADSVQHDTRWLCDQLVLMDCVSSTFEPGDFVGVTWDGGSALVNQKVKKVTGRHLAVGQVVQRYASATTQVWVRLYGRKLAGLFNTTYEAPGASTAAAGSTYSDAGALPAGTSDFYPTTAADDTKGVIINAADQVTGRRLFIGNGVSNKILKVYGPAGAVINGAAANTAFSSVSGKGVIIQCLSGSGNTWLAF